MIKLRIAIPLIALLLVAAPSPSQASDTLHFISATRTSTKHVYKFRGYFNYVETDPNYDTLGLTNTKSAERVGFSDDVTYYPSSGFAVQVMTMLGSYGSETATSDWGCTDDPWLNPQARCTQERSKVSFNYSLYLWQYCPGGKHGHWCLAGLGLVPKAMVPWLHDGPPAPTTSGPTHSTDENKVMLTASYARGTANRVYIQQWYCPPGHDGPPTNTPGDLAPFGGGGPLGSSCTSKVSNPVKTSPSSTHTAFMMAYPQSRPKGGIWYVRTRLGSNTYGDGVWGDWHRTVIVATTGRVDYGSPTASLSPHKVKIATAPRITAPYEGEVYHGSVRYSFLLPPHASYGSWTCCSMQWKRAVVVTAENRAYAQVHTPGQTAFPTPPMPSQGAELNHTPSEFGPVYHGTFPYMELGPHDRTSGYRYWFRIREHYLPGKKDGQWSAWRSFIVQQAPTSSPKPFRRMHVQAGSKQSGSAGTQQNSHKLAPSMPMHLQLQIRR